MRRVLWWTALGSFALLASCGGGGGGGGDDDEGGGSIPGASREVVVFAWNDLGMHCLNPTYDSAVVLPPYNTLWAQVVQRGNPPQIITSNVSVTYRILNNSTSQKASTPTSGSPVASDFTLFWQNAQALFGLGAPLTPDTGLTGNRVDPAPQPMAHNGSHFEATGIPVTPLDDDLKWSPYQVAEITVKNAAGAIIAQTQATVPTSDEIRCGKCHGATVEPFLVLHNADEGTSIPLDQPVLCASCHASPALGTPLQPGVPYLSAAIHSFHGHLDPQADPVPTCFDCHPGEVTRCNRSLRHTGADGNCTTCHGSLATVGDSINAGQRVPWVEEPKCATCHGGTTIPQVDTGSTLYRNAAGHGGMACPACHGSPHAMLPSREASDGYQAAQYQGVAITIGSCGVCHDSSRGGGASEFGEEHGGTNGRRTACHTCHTVVPATPTQWPHAYKWNAR